MNRTGRLSAGEPGTVAAAAQLATTDAAVRERHVAPACANAAAATPLVRFHAAVVLLVVTEEGLAQSVLSALAPLLPSLPASSL